MSKTPQGEASIEFVAYDLPWPPKFERATAMPATLGMVFIRLLRRRYYLELRFQGNCLRRPTERFVANLEAKRGRQLVDFAARAAFDEEAPLEQHFTPERAGAVVMRLRFRAAPRPVRCENAAQGRIEGGRQVAAAGVIQRIDVMARRDARFDKQSESVARVHLARLHRQPGRHTFGARWRRHRQLRQ